MFNQKGFGVFIVVAAIAVILISVLYSSVAQESSKDYSERFSEAAFLINEYNLLKTKVSPDAAFVAVFGNENSSFTCNSSGTQKVCSYVSPSFELTFSVQ
jgi:hypothetical protein